MKPRKVLFVTGQFAEPALRETVGGMEADFASEVAVMKITVAALMTPDWIAKFLEPPEDVDLVLLPGLCRGDVEPLEEATGLHMLNLALPTALVALLAVSAVTSAGAFPQGNDTSKP